MEKLHLICNAHLDPVWQWRWDEGAAAALSTFRVAADFCEEFEDFVFNHNESLLYLWIKEYEPSLYARIKKLVQKGRWHIMGGWFLQPDCVMVSGESFVRQILKGRTFFEKEFGQRPTTAVSMDAFGHSRGLVQILRLSGYDSYMFMRPTEEDGTDIPKGVFKWWGYDGSFVNALHFKASYNTLYGESAKDISCYIDENPEQQVALRCWGIGNHGGGPSRLDLQNIAELIAEKKGTTEIVHSTPECFFAQVLSNNGEMKEYSKSITHTMIGCYTSANRIKQLHRRLENELYLTEKMVSHADILGYMDYPKSLLAEAEYDLLFSEFHDILPGTSTKIATEDSVRMLYHGLEILSRIQTKAFFALSGKQAKVNDGEIPIMIYNPHPYEIEDVFECEYMLADQNWDGDFTLASVYSDDKPLPSQTVKEASNINLDWRKRVAFSATLKPFSMNRFDCKLHRVAKKPEYKSITNNEVYLFDNGRIQLKINTKTGLMTSFVKDGFEYLKSASFELEVFEDTPDSWAMRQTIVDKKIGVFALMNEEESATFAGVTTKKSSPIHIIEDGDVFTRIEAFFRYDKSSARVVYTLPKQSDRVKVEVKLFNQNRDIMIRLAINTAFDNPKYIGQAAFGIEPLTDDGNENVIHKWMVAHDETNNKAISLINDGLHGCANKGSAMRQSLCRTVGYTAHPIEELPLLPDDRFSDRIDMGERDYTFYFSCSEYDQQVSNVDYEALFATEKPIALSFFPSGNGEKEKEGLQIQGARLDAFKKALDGNGYIARLFNTKNEMSTYTISYPDLNIKSTGELQPFQLLTLRLNNSTVQINNLMEERLGLTT